MLRLWMIATGVRRHDVMAVPRDGYARQQRARTRDRAAMGDRAEEPAFRDDSSSAPPSLQHATIYSRQRHATVSAKSADHLGRPVISLRCSMSMKSSGT